jgi:hypothetical protein
MLHLALPSNEGFYSEEDNLALFFGQPYTIYAINYVRPEWGKCVPTLPYFKVAGLHLGALVREELEKSDPAN